MGRRIAIALGLGIAAAAVAVSAGGPAEPTSSRLSAPVSGAGSPRYLDRERGVSAPVPAGWHAAGPLTSLNFPREVVALASFPLRHGGSCGPDHALQTLPADGALIFVLEYRPARGEVWTGGIRRSNFPPRPRRLARGAPRSFECFARPGHLLHFRDADRPLQIMVALGARATPERRRSVERVLDGLRFTAIPPTRRLRLRRAPYLGVSCARANSIACDRVRLAVWLRTPAERLTATIDGHRFRLRPPEMRAGYWEGALRPAGMLRPGAALHITPDRGRFHWEGRHAVRAVVHIEATGAHGARSSTDIAVDLHAGYG